MTLRSSVIKNFLVIQLQQNKRKNSWKSHVWGFVKRRQTTGPPFYHVALHGSPVCGLSLNYHELQQESLHCHQLEEETRWLVPSLIFPEWHWPELLFSRFLVTQILTSRYQSRIDDGIRLTLVIFGLLASVFARFRDAPRAITFPTHHALLASGPRASWGPSASRNTLSVSTITDGNARRGGAAAPFLPLRWPDCTLSRLRAEEYDPAGDPVDSDPGAVFEGRSPP